MKLLIFLLFLTTFSFGQVGDDVYQDTSGGIITHIHEYSSVGANTFDVPSYINEVDVLIVAGGGGGAGNTGFNSAGGGAGGAGGLIFEAAYTVTPGSTIPLFVGDGGNGINSANNPAANGENSEFDGLIALGGGGGILTSGTNNNAANNGGSGGGGRENPAGIGLQPTSPDGGFGNDGARNVGGDNGGAGGGGAGSEPTNITGDDGGNGGDGLDYTGVFGTQFGDNGFFSGGGGGGGDADGALGLGGLGGGGNGASARDDIAPIPGMPNTGGGGGGGSSEHPGVNGGSGIILIKYVEPNPLPIELISFNAKPFDGEVKLSWSTASERNNEFFTLERSKDGMNFEVVGKVDGAGNSNHQLDYEFYDESPLLGVSYYRLKQTDFDGEYSYSDIESVTFEEDTIQVYPNPVVSGSEINFDLTLDKENPYQIEFLDLNGKIISAEELNSNTHSIDLPKGIYLLRIYNKNNIFHTGKIIVK